MQAELARGRMGGACAAMPHARLLSGARTIPTRGSMGREIHTWQPSSWRQQPHLELEEYDGQGKQAEGGRHTIILFAHP